MKRFLVPALAVLGIAAIGYLRQPDRTAAAPIAADEAGGSAIADAIDHRLSRVPVAGAGTVVKLLPDDTEGSRHQRFLLRLDSGQTILIAHNIDLAPRVAPLEAGDHLAFHGEFAWNPRGGVVHWTHRDPQRRHADGWIEHDGKTFD